VKFKEITREDVERDMMELASLTERQIAALDDTFPVYHTDEAKLTAMPKAPSKGVAEDLYGVPLSMV